MKNIKIYLGVVTALLICALGLGIYVWYQVQEANDRIQNINVPETKPIESVEQEADVSRTESREVVPSGKKEDATTTTVTQTPTVTTVPDEPIVVDTDTLSDTQRSMLETFGYGGDTLTITPAMINCARDAVGNTRLTEILDGSAPSPLESLKLLPCFKAE